MESSLKIIFSISQLSENSKISQLWTHQTHIFWFCGDTTPKKDRYLWTFSKFSWRRVESLYFRTIIFWKYLNISGSYWINIYFEKVSILSEQIWRRADCWHVWKMIFLNFLIRVHSWYSWEIHFLNFRDFQKIAVSKGRKGIIQH